MVLSAMAGHSAEEPHRLYVNPDGNDANSGLSAGDAYRTIQAALDHARPGTVIVLAPGNYHEQVRTVRPGTPAMPITIRGPETGDGSGGSARAILYGGPAFHGTVFAIDHSYYHLEGFTIDGQQNLAKAHLPTQLDAAAAFKDRVQSSVSLGQLVYIGYGNNVAGVTGVVLDNMYLTEAGQECVRLRNNASGNIVENSVIQWCGMYANRADPDVYRYHNGEGVYIGTSPKSTEQPLHGKDHSSRNVVRGNMITTFGSECVDIKEGSADNIVVGNTCRDNAEPRSYGGSNMEIRGGHNQVINNTIGDSLGVNILLGSDGPQYDSAGNTVRGNVLGGAATGAPSILNGDRSPGLFCGNVFRPAAADPVSGVPAGNPETPCPAPSSTASPG
jgi:hypothetical protein